MDVSKLNREEAMSACHADFDQRLLVSLEHEL